MVHQPSTECSPVKKHKLSLCLFMILFFILFAALVFVLLVLFWPQKSDSVDEPPLDEAPLVSDEPIAESEPVKIDFQPVVDEWVAGTSGNKSVIIYDVERDEIVGTYNPEEDYNTASLYKLFVVYEGYRRLQNGTWDANSPIGVGDETALSCLDRAIRESYSPCAERLWAMIGHAELDNIIYNDFNIKNSSISTLVSNASDILAMMKIFYNHANITDSELIARMKDSFLNQPTTTYNWRQGLPSGFSGGVNVYDKVGWSWNGEYWDVYHDAAIIEFPEAGRHFIVVVMTNRVPYQRIRVLGTMIENAFNMY